MAKPAKSKVPQYIRTEYQPFVIEGDGGNRALEVIAKKYDKKAEITQSHPATREYYEMAAAAVYCLLQ